jgi:hypothetical protein
MHIRNTTAIATFFISLSFSSDSVVTFYNLYASKPITYTTQKNVGVPYCHSTFYPAFLPPFFQIFPEAGSVVVAELSPEGVV